jgi:hypothetical protein
MFELPFCLFLFFFLFFETVDGGIDNIISSEDHNCTLDGGDNSDTASDGGNNKSTASEHQSCRE